MGGGSLRGRNGAPPPERLTAVTCSEVTKNAVLGAGDQKVSMRSPHLVPDVAVVDPLLTVSCPPTTTAYTGLDALVQCIEPFLTHLSTPLSDLWAREGIVYGARNLRTAFHEPNNLAAREAMALCGLFSGVALANSKVSAKSAAALGRGGLTERTAQLGAVHGFAGVLGGMFPSAPHGAICGRLLAPCWRANAEALEEGSPYAARMREVAAILVDRPGASVEEAHAWIVALTEELGVPGLSHFGMREADIEVAVTKAATASSMQGNPVKLSHEVLADILRAAL